MNILDVLAPGGVIDTAPVAGEVADLDRVLALPRRPIPDEAAQKHMAALMTQRLRRDNPDCCCAQLRPEVVARGGNPCIKELFPVQGWVLHEAADTQGALGFIRIGGGKTLPGILLAMVAAPPADLPLRATILIPPSLRGQFIRDYKVASQHFNVPNLIGGPGPFYNDDRPLLRMLAYSELSGGKNSGWLTSERPHIIIADEAHSLKDFKAVRTKRFLAFLRANPSTRFFCWSGSLITRGVKDFAHLSAVALKQGSPTPLDRHVASVWADAIDPDPLGFEASGWVLKGMCEIGESVRQGFHRRLTETTGVVVTKDASIASELKLIQRNPPPIPDAVAEALTMIRGGTRPDGEQAESALQAAMWAFQASAGVYLKWVYPRGEDPELVERWFEARKAYNKEVRLELEGWPVVDLDSPGLLKEAAKRWLAGYKGDKPVWPSLAARTWFDVEDQVQPQTKEVIIDDWLCRDAAEWGKTHAGIIWTRNSIVGRTIAKLGRYEYFGAGAEAAAGIEKHKGGVPVVASMSAHWQGRNLQYAFDKMLFVQMAADWEQTMGRCFRKGQTSPVVEAHIYQHTPEMVDSLSKATENAQCAGVVDGAPRMLVYAERSGFVDSPGD